MGAGPAGGACALALARAGRAEVVLLDKSRYPRIKVCGSGLSPHALGVLDHLEIEDRFEPIRLHMAGMTAVGPGGRTVHLRGAKGAWVVPRVELDQGIVQAAIEHGATFHEGTRVTRLIRDAAGDVRGVETSSGTFEADLVVCGNGSPSNFEHQKNGRYGIRTIMGWWEGVQLPRPDEGIMIWDRRLDGYYAWAFPEPHDRVNIGLTIPEDAPRASRLRELFTELLDEHFGVALRGADQVGKWMGHPATVSTSVGDVTERRALWIGEAARMVSPGTVEGIGFAMESGAIAARIIHRHFDPVHGMTPLARSMYRTQLGLKMLPKFWAGEGLVRAMRSERLLSWSSRLLNPQWFAARAAALVGERH